MHTLYDIIELVRHGERVSAEDAVTLWREAPLWVLGELATERKRKCSGDMVFFNRNIHIEPTNICLFNCEFCSFRRREGDADAWYMTLDEVVARAAEMKDSDITEVHIVGGVHPTHTLDSYCDMIRGVKSVLPNVTVKAYTAVEILYMIRRAEVSIVEGLTRLKDAGMECIPGGGAEIFDEELRSKICPDKCSSSEWLAVHRAAHNLGIKTNCTMLYGHIESIEQRVDHLMRLRKLQDEAPGFDAFIALKYRSRNNRMSEVGECSVKEDLRTIAMSRIILDNIPHIKAYWVAYGKATTEMALAFGADDIDGTIDNTTKIYSMAGGDERPGMSVEELCSLVRDAGFVPVERDTHYNIIKRYDNCDEAKPTTNTSRKVAAATAAVTAATVAAASTTATTAATTASVATGAVATSATAATKIVAEGGKRATQSSVKVAETVATAATTAVKMGATAITESNTKKDSEDNSTIEMKSEKRQGATQRNSTKREKESWWGALVAKIKGPKRDKATTKGSATKSIKAPSGGRRRGKGKGGKWQRFWDATKRAYQRYTILFHILFIFIFLLILVGALYLGLKWGTRHNETTAVPNFIGMTLDEAERTAAAAELHIVVRDTVFDEYAMPGEVLEQSPRTSDIRTVTVKPGRNIYLTINTPNSRMVDMINVSGKTLRSAISDLARAGLTIERLIYEPDYSHDNVIRQRVGNREVTKDNIATWGKVPYNTGVTLYVTFAVDKNSRTTEEPNVVGMTMRQVKSALWNKGLNIGEVHYDNSIEDRIDRRDARVYMQVLNSEVANIPRLGDAVSLYLTCDSLLVDSLAPLVKQRLAGQKLAITEFETLQPVIDGEEMPTEEMMGEESMEQSGDNSLDYNYTDIPMPTYEDNTSLEFYYGDEEDNFF